MVKLVLILGFVGFVMIRLIARYIFGKAALRALKREIECELHVKAL